MKSVHTLLSNLTYFGPYDLIHTSTHPRTVFRYINELKVNMDVNILIRFAIQTNNNSVVLIL